MKPWEIIKRLESDNSRLFKEAVLKEQALSGNSNFFLGTKFALDSLITFGIKKVPEKIDDSGLGLTLESFIKSISLLRGREVTGNAAKDLVANLMKTATKDEWNFWYRRILLKDLKCGVSHKTINTAAKAAKKPEFKVPVFECQLAQDSANLSIPLSGKKRIETKLDGTRVLTVVYPNNKIAVQQFSRNGKVLENFPHIREQFEKNSYQLDVPYVFDGEVMSTSFQDLMKQIHRKTNVQTKDAVLHVFDAIPLSEFIKGKYNCRQEERSYNLANWFENSTGLDNVAILDFDIVNFDTEEGKSKFKKINAAAIKGGYEGVMLKDLDAPYECKRSKSWLKVKPYIEVSLKVVAVEEGEGRNTGKMGALVCHGIDDGKEIFVNVGGGFSDEQREEYWKSRSEVIGKIAEVRADVITLAQNGTYYSLRFPRFEYWRMDKD